MHTYIRGYVDRRCVKWIGEVTVYDVEVKENDHAVDATRNAVMSRAGSVGFDSVLMIPLPMNLPSGKAGARFSFLKIKSR